MKHQMDRRLRLARVVRGWSQHRLAELANVDPMDISRIENGWIAPIVIQCKIAKALGMTVEELFAPALAKGA